MADQNKRNGKMNEPRMATVQGWLCHFKKYRNIISALPSGIFLTNVIQLS
jgi:hypothetical protein